MKARVYLGFGKLMSSGRDAQTTETIQSINNECKSVNNRVDTEKSAGSRVLLAQHPRPSRFSGHDKRYTQ